MTQMVTAVYEKGVLRPLKPLRLREKQEVNIYILPDDEEEAVDMVLAELERQGILTLPSSSGPDDEPLISEEQLRLLAERVAAEMGEGKTLSEIIIEEREQSW
jgi:predicted DNA-binding antitoxin AbrB/MazE fold protein